MALPGGSLHAIFHARASQAPERVAVCAGRRSITYGELDARSDRLAVQLGEVGVGPETMVGLCAPRTIEAIVGLLGILKAGGGYVPLDPTYPDERMDFILSDCGATVVVATKDCAKFRDGSQRAGDPAVVSICDDAIVVQGPVSPSAPRAASPSTTERDLAYVIYTSGSTGTPKGVAVEHRNVVRLFEQTDAWFQFGPDDVWTLFHSLAFDFSVWEIWGALLYGGRLVVVPEMVVRTPALFARMLVEERVTVLNQTPSAFLHLSRELVHGSRGRVGTDVLPLRLLIFGGERLRPTILRPWMDHFGDQQPQLVNMYGITETTVHCTYRRILADDAQHDGVSPIGVPIPDVRLYLLDESGRLVPDEQPGELHVAGGGVTRGYVNRPELTIQRFVRPPEDIEEDRLYRTGDRAMRRSDGDLVYLGRLDDQLKVRGYRIEPGEVEHCLAQVDGVASAVVTTRDFGDGDLRLVAHLLPGPSVSATAMARLAGAAEHHAMSFLPRHMRPALYEVVNHIPTTLQGKVDRHALAQCPT